MVNCQRVFCFNQMPEMCTWCDNIPVIDSIYCLIKLFSLFGSLTFIIILRGSFEQLKRQIGLDMANSDASSSTTCTVRVLVSFYLAATDDSSSTRTTDHAFISCSFFILRNKKLFLFADAFKNTRKFKISIERNNLHLKFISFYRNQTFLIYFSGKEKRDSGN